MAPDIEEPVWEHRRGGTMRSDRQGGVGESLEEREIRLSELADRKGYTLEKHGAGSPIGTLDYSLVEKETFSIVVDSHDGLDRVEVFLTDLPEDRSP
ncbi:MAG: hypothetical protein E6G65_07650 [Actinobacteria bacterium]|nr:MAG: hypothetical protein E6G65_07650 [Actinomycetota bacterium]